MHLFYNTVLHTQALYRAQQTSTVRETLDQLCAQTVNTSHLHFPGLPLHYQLPYLNKPQQEAGQTKLEQRPVSGNGHIWGMSYKRATRAQEQTLAAASNVIKAQSHAWTRVTVQRGI